MKAFVDQETCIGCGLCAETCPSVFELVDDKSQVRANPVPKDSEDCAEEAADGCPVEAISIS